MITELTDQELIALGARHRAGYLREQAGYTVGVAAAEGQPLADLLPAGYLDEVKAVCDALMAAGQDKALMAAEAKESTNANHAVTADAKVWRRKVARRASRARRLGKQIPDALLHVPQAKNGPALATDVTEKLKLLQAHQADMPGAGIDALLEDGQALLAALQSSDAQKELKRFADLPGSVQAFYRQKGLLYVGLKVINDAAQELHAGDTVAAARYNMGILYRNSKHRKPAPAPQPTPAQEPAAEHELVKV
ncbi:MAG: hypothetical protein ACHQQS_01050 [Thermoanaerobaculales bacterium]